MSRGQVSYLVPDPGACGELYVYAPLVDVDTSCQELSSSLFASLSFPPFSPEQGYMAEVGKTTLLGTKQSFLLLLSIWVKQGCAWTGLL